MLRAGLVILALASCCSKPQPKKPEPEPLVIVRRPCTTDAPPKATHRPIDPVAFKAMKPGDQLVVLLELLHDLSVAQKHMRNVHTLCGPLPAQPPDGGPQ